MRCARCNKIIREVYYVNGKPYGIECAKRRGYSDKKVIIKHATDIDEIQMSLFADYSAFYDWREGLVW